MAHGRHLALGALGGTAKYCACAALLADALKVNTALTSLDLSKNYIGDTGAAALAGTAAVLALAALGGEEARRGVLEDTSGWMIIRN